jgi:predicted O-methyltransferase YrrM
MLIMYWYGSHRYLNEYITMHKCRRLMEIGVYDGENAVTMIKTALKNHPPDRVEYYGFDFFNYHSKEEIAEKLDPLGCRYRLFQGNTLDTVPDASIQLPKIDLIFIDGGKSYREARSDWLSSARLMHGDTAVFVHNAGFSGVNRMIDDIPRDRYVVDVFHSASEGRVAQIKIK